MTLCVWTIKLQRLGDAKAKHVEKRNENRAPRLGETIKVHGNDGSLISANIIHFSHVPGPDSGESYTVTAKEI
jgi:hypothetical protein